VKNKRLQKMNKKSLLVLVLLLSFLTIVGCTNNGKENTNVTEEGIDLDLYYCEKDADCLITTHDINMCCESQCGIFVFNTKTIEKNKVWREDNCDFETETEFTDPKWHGCPRSPYFEFIECNIDKIRKAIAICKNNKCEIKYESTENIIDGIQLHLSTSEVNVSFIKKENIEPLIMNDPLYCFGRNSIPNCVCQEGYVKIVDVREVPLCGPKLCSYVSGVVFIGDEGIPNYDYCISSISRKQFESCEIINYQQGKDLCVLAYVGLTNDTSACTKIEDEHLKNECYT